MFGSVQALLSASADKPLWEAVLDDDCQDRNVSREDSLSKMTALWQTMKQSVLDYDPTRRSPCGLSGGQGARMAALDRSICGPFIQEVISTALKLGEHNACMGRIVAAPTAGACGVLPAVLIPLQRKDRLSDEDMVKCLYVSAGFGQVIATKASISGAEGGCQAEVGSASGMAAAALVHARGGSGEWMAAACAMALQNVLGLVCDPVAGLVEVPCPAPTWPWRGWPAPSPATRSSTPWALWAGPCPPLCGRPGKGALPPPPPGGRSRRDGRPLKKE